MNRLRALLVGFGKISHGYESDPVTTRALEFVTHRQVLAHHPRIHLAAVVDSSPAVRSEATKLGIAQTYASAAEANGEPWDIVVLATPPGDRLQTLKKLRAVRAVLCEKPLGQDEREAEQMVSYCQEHRIALQVNFWRRGDLHLRALANGELSSKIGGVQVVNAIYGNGIRNNGSHLVDWVQMFFGSIEKVEFARETSEPQSRFPLAGDLNIDALLALSSGLRVRIAPLNYTHYRELALDIWGERGRIAITHEGLSSIFYPRVPHRSLSATSEVAWDRGIVQSTGSSTALFNMYDNLVRHLDDQIPLLSSGTQSLVTDQWVQKIIEKACT